MDFSNYFFLRPNKGNVEEITSENSYTRKSKNWHEEYMEYETLHRKTKGKSQVIALIDSGISNFQKSKVATSYCVANDSNDLDENGHGTMMCSLILGADNLPGIAPQAKVYSYKVVDKSGKVEPEILSKAIDKAIKDDVTIINISLGSYFNNEKIKKSIKNAIKSGIIVVASSGDYETDDMMYPAKYEDCISVGAIDNKLDAWEGTNAIDQCDILAPGVNVYTMLDTGDLAETTGTSQSTALISGYVALIKDYGINCGVDLNVKDVKEILKNINPELFMA